MPGAETMLGLERYAWVCGVIHDLAGYVPDLRTHEGSRTLRFTDRAGAERAFGASARFDNAYDGPFTEPLEDGPLDFHLVASNEAWFKGDQENDQMMAFSHLAAIATGRSIVRATNSGVTAVVGPDGKEVARLSSEAAIARWRAACAPTFRCRRPASAPGTPSMSAPGASGRCWRSFAPRADSRRPPPRPRLHARHRGLGSAGRLRARVEGNLTLPLERR